MDNEVRARARLHAGPPRAPNMELLKDETSKTDEEILFASLKNPNLFEILVARYQEAFLRKAEGIVHNREEAEDIVQETFAKIYLYGKRFAVQEGASFKSWGYKILMNTAFTHYKKRKRDRTMTAPLDPEMYENLKDSENVFEKLEISEYLVSMLDRMPEELRRALRMHFLEDKPQKEIAELEGVSVGAIKTRIHRAKKEFRNISNEFK